MEVNNILQWTPVVSSCRSAAAPRWHDGCGYVVLMDADRNKIRIEAQAFRGAR